MNVIHRRGWEMPEHLATPEHMFLNRRAFLSAGVAAGAAIALKPGPASAQRVSDIPDPSIDLYPAKRNELSRFASTVSGVRNVLAFSSAPAALRYIMVRVHFPQVPQL